MIRSSLIAISLLACGQHDHGASPSPSSPAPTPAPAAPTPTAAAPAPAPAPAPPAPTAPGAQGSGYDVRHPCSMITAAEVSDIVQFPVTAQDDGFRCRFFDAKQGWLQLELTEVSLRSTQDICTYAPDKRKVVPGVGDSASVFGAEICVKLGDVAILVDSSNLRVDSPALHRHFDDQPEVRVAKLVVSRIH